MSGQVEKSQALVAKLRNSAVPRLDVPSSGLILAAKTYDAYFDLLGQLA